LCHSVVLPSYFRVHCLHKTNMWSNHKVCIFLYYVVTYIFAACSLTINLHSTIIFCDLQIGSHGIWSALPVTTVTMWFNVLQLSLLSPLVPSSVRNCAVLLEPLSCRQIILSCSMWPKQTIIGPQAFLLPVRKPLPSVFFPREFSL
jgi:hypothetical protein